MIMTLTRMAVKPELSTPELVSVTSVWGPLPKVKYVIATTRRAGPIVQCVRASLSVSEKRRKSTNS